MIRNYFKIALRNLMKNKVFSIINIFGLTVGLTCCILICLYISHETSYDKHQPNANQLALLGMSWIDETGLHKGLTTPAPLGRMMQQEYPELAASSRTLDLFRDDKTLLQVKNADGSAKSFYEKNGLLADSNFFEVIKYSFKEGSPQTALDAPSSVVISEEIAKKLFGDQPALDKLVRISSSTNGDSIFRITGVFETPKAPTHIQAGFFISFKGGDMDGLANDNPSLINNNMFNTYVHLKDGADPEALAQKFPSFIKRHMGEELKANGRNRGFFVMPISGIHLSGLERAIGAGGNKTTLYILGSIAVLTLLIACINFMNLSTANSSKRAAEVGVRKVLGAQKSSLLRQFLGESFLMAAIALVCAIVLSLLLLPVFENVSGKTLIIPFQQKVILAVFFLVLAVVTGFLAGSYPAFYLSSFKPIKVLKGRFTNSLSAISLRKGLVVFQFVVSIVLIVASVVIANQMKFLRLQDLGFVKDQQVIIPLRTETAKTSITAFKNETRSQNSIAQIGAGMAYPGIFHPQDWVMYAQGQPVTNTKKIYINLVDDDFLQTLGVQLLAGRLFSKEFPGDTAERFVINEETVKKFGFASPQDAVGKWIGFNPGGEEYKFIIVGVVKNFHFKDLHENIEPFAFRMYNEADFNYLVARTKGTDISQSLAGLRSTWKKLNPNEPFEYSFLDQDFQKNYEAEERQASLINYFTIIAIIISCLGLFGLATFTAEQRTKEIGIRKVLGASVAGVVGLLSKDFLKLVIIAVVIASPLAWWGMNKWLENFAYQTTIGWQVFVFTAFIAVFIAFATISIQALKSAFANPIKSLRTE